MTIWPVCDNFKANTKLHVVYHGCCVTLERINNAAASSNHIHSRTTYIVIARKWPTRHNFVIHNVLFPGTGRSHNGGDSTHPDVCLVSRQHIALGRQLDVLHSRFTRLTDSWMTVFYVDSFQGVLRGRKKIMRSSQDLNLVFWIPVRCSYWATIPLAWSRGDMVQWISLRHDTNSARQGLAATTSKLGIYQQEPLSTGSVDKNIWLEFRRPSSW